MLSRFIRFIKGLLSSGLELLFVATLYKPKRTNKARIPSNKTARFKK